MKLHLQELESVHTHVFAILTCTMPRTASSSVSHVCTSSLHADSNDLYSETAATVYQHVCLDDTTRRGEKCGSCNVGTSCANGCSRTPNRRPEVGAADCEDAQGAAVQGHLPALPCSNQGLPSCCSTRQSCQLFLSSPVASLDAQSVDSRPSCGACLCRAECAYDAILLFYQTTMSTHAIVTGTCVQSLGFQESMTCHHHCRTFCGAMSAYTHD